MSSRIDGQWPIEEMEDNLNPMDFGNPQNESSLFWDVVFRTSIHNHMHNIPKVTHIDMEKLNFVNYVKGPHVEANRVCTILCAVEDRGKDLLNKKMLENDKARLTVEVEKLRKQMVDAEENRVTLNHAKWSILRKIRKY